MKKRIRLVIGMVLFCDLGNHPAITLADGGGRGAPTLTPIFFWPMMAMTSVGQSILNVIVGIRIVILDLEPSLCSQFFVALAQLLLEHDHIENASSGCQNDKPRIQVEKQHEQCFVFSKQRQ